MLDEVNALFFLSCPDCVMRLEWQSYLLQPMKHMCPMVI